MGLSRNYSQLKAQIDSYAKKSGRDPASIQLIAVTKQATMEQMHEAYRLGIRHFGESRVQTAIPKIASFPSDIVWHFIGSLQSNKLGKILEHFSMIHSVDSIEVAKQIAKRKPQGRQFFLQVNTSGEVSKHGFSEKILLEQFDMLLALELNFIGLMTIAPLRADPLQVQNCFRALCQLRDRLSVKKYLPHLSMGMSQDFPIAIAEGATFLRIGSVLFHH